jgi:hypothetical protein
MSLTFNGLNGLSFGDGTSQNTAASGFGFKNRIINGDMRIDQRNFGASVTSGYAVDRWQTILTAISSLNVTSQQVTDVPSGQGFTNSYKVTVTSAATSYGSGGRFGILQRIEGNNFADFMFGSASAKQLVLSFWVKASITGTYSVGLLNNDSSRAYPVTYTINAANTWEYKTLIVNGDTLGTWLTNSGRGLQVEFCLGADSSRLGTANTWNSAFVVGASSTTQLSNTNGATFYLTGVQIEKGSIATNFDYRPYGYEFDLCRRYCEVYSGGTYEEGSIPQYYAQVDGANRPEVMIMYYPKRTGPTFTLSGNFAWNSAANTGLTITYAGAYVGTFTRGTNLFFSSGSGVSTNSLSGIGSLVFGASGGGKIIIDAEL